MHALIRGIGIAKHQEEYFTVVTAEVSSQSPRPMPQVNETRIA